MKPVAESIGSALGRIGGAVDTGFREGAAAGTDIQGQPLITGLMRQGGGVVGGGMAALSQSLMEVFGEKGGRDALALLSTLPMAPEAAHATTLLKTMSPDVSPSASPTARVPQTPLEVARDLRADRAETLRNPEPATSAIPAPDPTITDFSGLTNPLPTRGQGVESVLAANNVDSAIAAAKNVTGTGPYRPVTVGEVAARDGLTDPSEAYRRVVAENAAGGRAAGIPDFDMVRDAGRSFNRGQPLEPVNEQPGLSGAYAGAAPPGYTRTDVGDVGGGGSPGVRAVYQSTASDASVPVFHEIGGDGTGETFAQNIAESKQGNKFGASVAVYPTDEYNQMRLLVTPDRGAGFALHGDDIVSVYRKPDGPKGVVSPILDLATQEGGRRLDAFDTVLPGIYGNNGFKAVARLAWNDAYAPEGWDFNTYRNFNGGRPDVVFMIYDPNHNLPYKAGDGIRVADYDAGVAAQDRALRQVGQPTEAPAEVVQSPTRRLPGIYGGEPDVTTGPFEPQAAGAAASSRDMTGGTLFGRSAREIKGQQADMELADLMKTPQPGDARDIIPGATQTKAEIELNPTVSRDAKGLRQEFREGFNDHEKANNELYHAWIDQVVPPREQVGTMKDIRETNWKNAEKTVFGDDPNGQPVNTADIVAHINDVFSDPIDKSNSYLKNAFKPFLEDMTDKKGNPIDMGAKELYGIRQEMGRKVKDMATDTDLAHVRDEFRDLINVTTGP
jgi:hypothetical protein